VAQYIKAAGENKKGKKKF